MAKRWNIVQNLGAIPKDICRLYTPSGQDIRSVIGFILIHSGTQDAFTLLGLHDVYPPEMATKVLNQSI
ncbi:hypothetical protein B0A55_03982 [Friedmanniomyces simplex]|uniref:Uncharacterized protein n=1 Tax=Friedmanniomyces simplex TaxID=329884 RepID=A0A4U0XG10_9PEZI|nr:hypothetical protein B0A55_03982 [Friedmanniomyces simplex]